MQLLYLVKNYNINYIVEYISCLIFKIKRNKNLNSCMPELHEH